MQISKQAKNIDKNNVLKEYPRPQLVRDSYINLNGEWDFLLDEEENLPSKYEQKILVPFAVETELSGIKKRVNAKKVMHYQRKFVLPEGFNKGKILLHFEAVDQICDVYVNGEKIGHHEGGYFPFCFEMPNPKEGENLIRVEVKDNVNSDIFPRGKQFEIPVGVFYEATSGIWQTVWIESVPETYIESLKITPSYDEKKVYIQAKIQGKFGYGNVVCSNKLGETIKSTLDPFGRAVIDLSENFHPWSPDDPFLYDLNLEVENDKVTSYFGVRKIAPISHNGFTVIGVNEKPLYLSGVLDQGYWSGSGLTAPSDQALIDDIEMCKKMGFNMIRKHIKIEPQRWYYHCDRLGIIVNQDILNGGTAYLRRYIWLRPFIQFNKNDTIEINIRKMGRGNKKSRAHFVKDLGNEVELLYNSTCIGIWTMFNEGWGQFNSKDNLLLFRNMDPTRLIDATSGWFDQGVGDFDSRHFYFQNVAKAKPDNKRIFALTECGGFNYRIPGHCWEKGSFGYRYCKDKEGFTKLMRDLFEKKIKPAIENKGLALSVYTQLSDVEKEANGLISYDREELKIDLNVMKSINDSLKF